MSSPERLSADMLDVEARTVGDSGNFQLQLISTSHQGPAPRQRLAKHRK